MNEKNNVIRGFIICILLFLFAGTLGAALGFSAELENVRQQLDSTRIELRNAENRQSEIREIVTGTSDILSKSINSVADIRKQIAEIRKSYEELEKCLYNRNADSYNTVSNSNDSNF